MVLNLVSLEKSVSEIVNILTKAKSYINQFGWLQGDYGNPNQGFCLTGAIRAAVDVTDDRVSNLPPILEDVYAIFTEPLVARGLLPYRYKVNTPHRALTSSEVIMYREDLADAGEIIEFNDNTNKESALALLDDAIEAAKGTYVGTVRVS